MMKLHIHTSSSRSMGFVKDNLKNNQQALWDFVCACIHAYIHTYIHTYIYVYIHTHISPCRGMGFVKDNLTDNQQALCDFVCVPTYIHTWIHTYIYVYKHTHISPCRGMGFVKDNLTDNQQALCDFVEQMGGEVVCVDIQQPPPPFCKKSVNPTAFGANFKIQNGISIPVCYIVLICPKSCSIAGVSFSNWVFTQGRKDNQTNLVTIQWIGSCYWVLNNANECFGFR